MAMMGMQSERRVVLGVMLMALLIIGALNLGSAKAVWWVSTYRGPPTYISSAELGHTNWNKTYGGFRIEVAYSVIQTSDGGYAIAGYTTTYGAGKHDFWLVKTDSTGNLEWSRTYGGPESNEEAYSVIQTSDGGYLIAGEKSDGDGEEDFWLVKTDSSGNLEWSRTYGGSGGDVARSVIQTSDGGYVIAGYTNSYGAGGFDFWLVKTDSAGNIEWSKTYGGPEWDLAKGPVIQTSDGGYVMAGYTRSYGAGEGDFWLVKTDSAGNLEWNKTYGGPREEVAYSVIQTSDGGYVMAGYTESYGAGIHDFWLVKTDSAGNLEWSKAYGGPKVDVAYSVVQTSDGGYLIAGYTNSYGAGGFDFWLVKTDSSGNIEWSRTYGGPKSDEARSVIQTLDGGYAVVGLTQSYGAGMADFWLIKILHPTFPLKVCVTGARGQLLSSAKVDLLWENNTLFKTKNTNIDGYVYFEAPLGNFKIKVEYKGLTQTRTIYINEPKTVYISLDIFLEIFGTPLTTTQTALLVGTSVIAVAAIIYIIIKKLLH